MMPFVSSKQINGELTEFLYDGADIVQESQASQTSNPAIPQSTEPTAGRARRLTLCFFVRAVRALHRGLVDGRFCRVAEEFEDALGTLAFLVDEQGDGTL